MRRQIDTAIIAVWLICMAVLSPPLGANSESQIFLRLIPNGKTDFTNVLQHYVYLDAETANAETLQMRLLNPEGMPEFFQTRRHIERGFNPVRSENYTLKAGQVKAEGLNICFPANMAVGEWKIQVTARAVGLEPVTKEIKVTVKPPYELEMKQLRKVREMILGLDGKETVKAEKGKIRYIAQNPKDPWFVKEYWMSPGYDLRERANQKCTRAIFSMALSYLGIDCTPVGMSDLVRAEEIFYTYDSVCRKLGSVTRTEGELETLWEKYERGEGSPILLHFTYSGGMHGVLLAARDEENPELYYAVTTGQRINTSAYPGGITRDAIIPILIEEGKIGARIQSPMLNRYHRGKIDQIWQWQLTDDSEAAQQSKANPETDSGKTAEAENE